MIAKLQFRSDEELTSASYKQSMHENPALDNSELARRLNQILEALMADKKELEEEWARERLGFEAQTFKLSQVMEELLDDRQQLKSQLQTLSCQLGQKKQEERALRKNNSQLMAERDSLRSVVDYLESNNREISFENYSIKKTLIEREGIHRPTKNGWATFLHNSPKFLMTHLDQDSIYEQTANLNQPSHQDLQRVATRPVAQIGLTSTFIADCSSSWLRLFVESTPAFQFQQDHKQVDSKINTLVKKQEKEKTFIQRLTSVREDTSSNSQRHPLRKRPSTSKQESSQSGQPQKSNGIGLRKGTRYDAEGKKDQQSSKK